MLATPEKNTQPTAAAPKKGGSQTRGRPQQNHLDITHRRNRKRMESQRSTMAIVITFISSRKQCQAQC